MSSTAHSRASARAQAQPSRFWTLHQYRQQLRRSGALHGLSQSAALVLLALADFADPAGNCWPSLARIVAENPVSERSARRGLRELEASGLLVTVERPGHTTLYRLVMDVPTPATPATMLAAPGQHALQRGQTGPENRALEPSIKEPNQEADPAPHMSPIGGTSEVVVSSEEGGDLLPLHLPADLAELPRKRRGISTATIRKLIGEHGIEVVRQGVAVVNRQYPNDTKVRSFGALLSAAIRDDWKASTPGADKEARATAIAMATPPAETRWAKPRDGGAAVEVLEVDRDLVRTASGVIPRHLWPKWQWLATIDAEPNAHKAQEGPRNLPQVAQDPTTDGEPLDAAGKLDTLRSMYAKPVPALKRLALKLAADWRVPLESLTGPVPHNV